MIKAMFLLAITVGFSFGLTNEQIQKIQDVYTIGKNIKTSDGQSFEKTLASIMGQESDWGNYFNSNTFTKDSQLKSLTSSIGDFQIQVATAQMVIKSHPKLSRKYGHMVYEGNSVYFTYKRNLEQIKNLNDKYNQLKKSNNHTAIVRNRLNHIHQEILNLKKINKTLIVNASKDQILINNLLHNHKFSADIAGHYLVLLYETAKNKKFPNSYLSALSAYNGGWINTPYCNLIRKKMITIDTLLKDRIIL